VERLFWLRSSLGLLAAEQLHHEQELFNWEREIQGEGQTHECSGRADRLGVFISSCIHTDVPEVRQIKLIKFFAWEERWIDRAMTAREEEMKWMVKCMPQDCPLDTVLLIRYAARLNSIIFNGFVSSPFHFNITTYSARRLWGFAPVSLSLVSFFTYVWFGNELTVGKAFTVCISPFRRFRFVHCFARRLLSSV
jgi:hypothetical protein